MLKIKVEVRILSIISKDSQSSLMACSQSLIAPSIRIMFDLCLSSGKIQTIIHIVAKVADGGHKGELKFVFGEQKCTAEL